MKRLFHAGLSVGIVSLICAPLFLGAETNQTASASSVLGELAVLEKELSFKEVVQATTRCRVLEFDTNNPAHVELQSRILAAAALAGERAAHEGLAAERPYEAGNQLEPFIRAALRESGLEARVPRTTDGKEHATGYPDIEVTGATPCYIEVKTYNAATAHGSLQTFHYSPSARSKITRDAVHFLLTYQMERVSREGKKTFVPIRWKLMTLEDLKVGVRCEFNLSNRKLYGPESAGALVAEGYVK